MKNLWQQLKFRYREGDVSIKLIYICVSLFLLSMLVNVLFYRNSPQQFEDFFGSLAGWDGFLHQPWGLITYTFFHAGLLHLAINMLMLWVIGKMFLQYFRTNDLLTFFLFGALAGSIAFTVLSQLFPIGGILIGASAGIYALFFALASYMPKHKIQLMFIRLSIPLDYIAYGLIAYDLILIVSGKNVGGQISHLGGAAFGFFYMKAFEKGNDFLGHLIRPLFVAKSVRKPGKTQRPPRDDYDFNSQKVDKQKKIDKILDKISGSGYESLSREEKDFLFKAGKND